MKRDRQKTGAQKLARRAAWGAAGALTAGSLLLGSVFPDGETLLRGNEASAQTTLLLQERKQGDGTDTESPGKKDGLSQRLSAFFLRQSAPVRTLLLWPLWALGRALIGVGGWLLSALSGTFGGALLGFLANLALLFLLFYLAYKCVRPEGKLKDLLRPRTFLWIVGAALLMSLLDAFLPLAVERYSLWSTLIKALAGVVIVGGLTLRFFGWRRRRAAVDASYEPEADEPEQMVTELNGRRMIL